MKPHKIALIIALSANLAFANTSDLLQNAQVKPSSYYEPSDSAAYLGTSMGIMFVGAVMAAGLLYLMPESVTKWNKDESGDIFTKWRTKTRKGPVVDSDEAWLNYVAHPYFGAVYYMQPRMAGYSWASGVAFSFVASNLFWEYGIEGFAEIPSWQDIIITPAVGSILGEGFYRLTRYIQMNDNKLFGQWWLGKLIGWVLDPLGNLIYSTGLGEAFGIHNKNAVDSNEAQIISTPILPNGKGGVSVAVWVRF